MNRNDIGQAFVTLIGEMFIKYRGVNIEKLQEGYRVFGSTYPTIYLAQKRVDLSFNKFSNSIWQADTNR